MQTIAHSARTCLDVQPSRMVVIQVKRTEADSFLYECSVVDSNDAVVRELVRGGATRCTPPPAPFPQRLTHNPAPQCYIHNYRDKVARLADAMGELANHGPSKPEAEKGIDEVRRQPVPDCLRGQCPHFMGAPHTRVADPREGRTADIQGAVLQ